MRYLVLGIRYLAGGSYFIEIRPSTKYQIPSTSVRLLFAL